MTLHEQIPLGATRHGDGTVTFLVWAPLATQVRLHLHPDRWEPMTALADGYFHTILTDLPADSRYTYELDGRDWPDPVSRSQPDGVHAPSAIIEPHFDWTDAAWTGRHLADCIVYEMHIGTFTPEGTFDAAIGRLDRLVDLGVNALEIMPVSQFPGSRNWGYDGVYHFAVQHSYGGAAALKRFVDACHARGLAVFLDVVYNHFGPEGNYLSQFAPYFTTKYDTPWGQAVDYEGPHAHGVRRFVLENARQWQVEFHLDGLRLDATDAIFDASDKYILQELVEQCRQREATTGRPFSLIAEMSSNRPKVVRPIEQGGYGLHAQWNFDFHHCLQAILTGDRHGYYVDFDHAAQLARCYRDAYYFTGQLSQYRGHFGEMPVGARGDQFIVYSQSHDEVGNRAKGDRLAAQVEFEALRFAAAAVLLSPFVPMLFMGEEYAEPSPFYYFVSHGDADLIEAVRAGRRREFAEFAADEDFPDPQSELIFERSRLQWLKAGHGRNLIMWAFYRELIALRKRNAVLRTPDRDRCEVIGGEPGRAIRLRRWQGDADQPHEELLIGLNASRDPVQLEWPAGTWTQILDADERLWRGRGPLQPATVTGGTTTTMHPWGVVVYARQLPETT
ncbi:malto-oligosyltrehalose trehalohydrolase [Tuwongella immobilis]|uniref:Malto-oligosyltrehalose trehalohydrolase n=1 Tax=Tuwongella immobilis TaxID=692036 RepID=A0A6C2YKD5_9BACT|nr:malto-oligosyltrehalose trehalohydrolase [Tuwongella immobilis]VIP01382.1 malto-oligosyltrehalose trehalohydrolase : Malto-oligosyltrehalose trehalohydrolase OS=Moorella thermoacetica (strain ATCC 39073) GN=Moth_1809 PE=3 SV=1: CBM_48: Alpha-amylase: DUF3459 [Tuwongella immobilis]VTR98239.1 malto-oligosyltrehalose trehalohydrolase : Malto-oligosyltrehalose trehalohydrolase OS=Moorella thermoacetica (strain ATCC 39073) GN=Moth_1809 PE=3 SV=1: CBM_48: Alpha-amylase: DUF3459 [Tuwongella immobilis